MEKEGINNLKIYLLDGRKKVILNIDKEKKWLCLDFFPKKKDNFLWTKNKKF